MAADQQRRLWTLPYSLFSFLPPPSEELEREALAACDGRLRSPSLMLGPFPSNVISYGQRKLPRMVTHCKGRVRDKNHRRTPKISKICLMTTAAERLHRLDKQLFIYFERLVCYSRNRQPETIQENYDGRFLRQGTLEVSPQPAPECARRLQGLHGLRQGSFQGRRNSQQDQRADGDYCRACDAMPVVYRGARHASQRERMHRPGNRGGRLGCGGDARGSGIQSRRNRDGRRGRAQALARGQRIRQHRKEWIRH